MRRIATVLAGAVLALIHIGTAQAVAPSAVALPKKATLLADGSVQITMKVRCHPHQQAFEWSVEVRQDTVHGNDGAGPVAGLITCDGHFHEVDAVVPGASGIYTAGVANVQALAHLYDAHEGSDVQLEDRTRVRLRP